MERKELLKLLNEIFVEAEHGRIVVDKEHGPMGYPVRFFTNIEGENRTKNSSCPTVIIPNLKDFFAKVEKYLDVAEEFYRPSQEYFELNDEDYHKFLLTCLFINAGLGDFNNFSTYVENRTTQLCGINIIDEECVANNNDYKLLLKTKKLNPNLEAPLKATFCFQSESDGNYELPSILYGTNGTMATIYAVQNMNKESRSKLAKRLDRLFRKVNKGTLSEDNITDVSPSAVVAITLFLAKMKKSGINKIEVPCILPLRGQIARNKIHMISNKQELSRVDRAKKMAEQERIDCSTTERFSYLFLRYVHHFKSSEFYYDEENEKILLNLKNETQKDDNIIFELEESIK